MCFQLLMGRVNIDNIEIFASKVHFCDICKKRPNLPKNKVPWLNNATLFNPCCCSKQATLFKQGPWSYQVLKNYLAGCVAAKTTEQLILCCGLLCTHVLPAKPNPCCLSQYLCFCLCLYLCLCLFHCFVLCQKHLFCQNFGEENQQVKEQILFLKNKHTNFPVQSSTNCLD